ncbi:MAG: hypothetical protein HAW59_06105 [Betaproteobacteria bacterium]|nr:hypothetical protein [Betaproteobacteria bacterium]
MRAVRWIFIRRPGTPFCGAKKTAAARDDGQKSAAVIFYANFAELWYY